MKGCYWTASCTRLCRGAFMELLLKVRFPVKCAGGQPAQPSHMRTARGMLGYGKCHMENNFTIMASLTRTVH